MIICRNMLPVLCLWIGHSLLKNVVLILAYVIPDGVVTSIGYWTFWGLYENKLFSPAVRTLLLQNIWPVSRNFIRNISVIGGANNTEGNFDFISILVTMATQRKNLKYIHKAISFKTTDPTFIKHYENHQCDIGSNWYT